MLRTVVRPGRLSSKGRVVTELVRKKKPPRTEGGGMRRSWDRRARALGKVLAQEKSGGPYHAIAILWRL
jgi:hypothetical protein